MTEHTAGQLELTGLNGKRLTAVFDEPHVTSDFGALLLREVERDVGIVGAIAGAIGDTRRQSHVRHDLLELCAQRVFQIGCGYYDADDCDHLREDPALKSAVGRDPLADGALGSQPTMSRLENSVSARDLVRMGYAIIDNFTSSYAEAPPLIVLDMDPTEDRTYGKQQLSLFNAFFDGYCFMPYHIYEGLSGKLITTVLRPGKCPSSEEILSILKRVVRRIRRVWPRVRIVFRADSHHARTEVLDWLEAEQIDYVVAVAKNTALDRESEILRLGVKSAWERTGRSCRRFHSFRYAAGTWNRPRRLVARAVGSENGTDVRYIVTSFERAGAKYLYETVYCGRANAELRIKDHKRFLGSDRTSCHRKEANQFRLFLHSAAYVLMQALREKALKGTELAGAQFDTIRLGLLKIGARLEIRKTFIRFHLPMSCPLKSVISTVVNTFATVCQT